MDKKQTEITVTDDVVLVQMTDTKTETRTIAELFSLLTENEVSIDLINLTPVRHSADNLAFSVSSCDFSKVLKAIARLKDKAQTRRISVSGGYSKITLKGDRFPEETGIISASFSALSEANAEVFLVSSSDTTLSFLVQTELLDKALFHLEKAFTNYDT